MDHNICNVTKCNNSKKVMIRSGSHAEKILACKTPNHYHGVVTFIRPVEPSVTGIKIFDRQKLP